jgi:hypothetical protein
VLHWKRGASAFELAVCWIRALHSERGLPSDVARILDTHAALRGATVVIAIPELRTALPGGPTASQTDLWALLGSPQGPISLSVEGKALEPFGERVADWLGGSPSKGKGDRLAYLSEQLGIRQPVGGGIRYQLLHRSVSAVLEAERWHAAHAVVIIQSFAVNEASFDDWVTFGQLLGVKLMRGTLTSVPRPGGPTLTLGWLDSEVASDAEVAEAAA